LTIAAEFGSTVVPSVLWLNGELLEYGRQSAPGKLKPPKPSQPAPVPGDEVELGGVVDSGLGGVVDSRLGGVVDSRLDVVVVSVSVAEKVEGPVDVEIVEVEDPEGAEDDEVEATVGVGNDGVEVKVPVGAEKVVLVPVAPPPLFGLCLCCLRSPIARLALAREASGQRLIRRVARACTRPPEDAR
jgi:hypothetical protein